MSKSLTNQQKIQLQQAYKRFEERLKIAEEKFHDRLREIKKDAFAKMETIANAKEEKQMDSLIHSLDEV